MSLAEHAARLEQSLRTSTSLLQQLLRGLQQRRAAWVSARPSTIAPSPELESIATQLAAEEAARTELLRAIGKQVPLPVGVSTTDLHVNVARIAAALPAAAARTLRVAADLATATARKVRVEVTLGDRLLRFSQRAHDGLLAQMAGAAGGAAAAVYDRNARTLRGGAGGGTTGSLIDGRL